MRQIQPDEISSITKAFRASFVVEDAYGEPFPAKLSHRLLVFPTDGSVLKPDQFDALRSAVHMFGETNLFLASLAKSSSDDDWSRERECWVLDINDGDIYHNPPHNAAYLYCDNALFSSNGTWGMMISDEGHAIVAGSQLFIECLVDAIGLSPEIMAHAFLDAWRNLAQHGLTVAWIPRQLQHIYGPQETQRLLQGGFPELEDQTG